MIGVGQGAVLRHDMSVGAACACPIDDDDHVVVISVADRGVVLRALQCERGRWGGKLTGAPYSTIAYPPLLSSSLLSSLFPVPSPLPVFL